MRKRLAVVGRRVRGRRGSKPCFILDRQGSLSFVLYHFLSVLYVGMFVAMSGVQK